MAKLNAAQTFSAQQTLGAGAALNDTDMLLRAGTDASHGIGWYGTGKTFEGIVMEGPVIYGYWGGALGSKNGGDSIALRWDERRRVGIGTATPQRTLHVKDVMRLEPRATAPTSPAEGDMYMDSATHKLKVYDGTTWQNCW